jgi:hypothetical protein
MLVGLAVKELIIGTEVGSDGGDVVTREPDPRASNIPPIRNTIAIKTTRTISHGLVPRPSSLAPTAKSAPQLPQNLTPKATGAPQLGH